MPTRYVEDRHVYLLGTTLVSWQFPLKTYRNIACVHSSEMLRVSCDGLWRSAFNLSKGRLSQTYASNFFIQDPSTTHSCRLLAAQIHVRLLYLIAQWYVSSAICIMLANRPYNVNWQLLNESLVKELCVMSARTHTHGHVSTGFVRLFP